MAKKAIARKTSPRKDNVVRLDEKILLANVTKAAFGYARGEHGLADAIRAACGNNNPKDQKQVKEAFWIGHMGEALCEDAKLPTAEVTAIGRAVYAKKGTDRTPTEVAAYDNARQVWSRMLKRLNVPTAEPRGGGANAAGNVGNPNGRGARPGGNAASTPATTEGEMTENNSLTNGPISSITTLEQVVHVIKFEGTKLRTVANTHAKLLPPEWLRQLTAFADWTMSIADPNAKEEEEAEAPAPAKPAKGRPRKTR